MYPYFDLAHAAICCLAVREDLATGIQGHQLNMAVFFWYLVRSVLSSVRRVHWNGHFFQDTRKKTRPCLIIHPVNNIQGRRKQNPHVLDDLKRGFIWSALDWIKAFDIN